MSKIELNNIVSTQNVQLINDNFQKIEDVINKQMLARNPQGEPNFLQGNLDLNGNRLINVPAPVLDTDIVRKRDVDALNASTVAGKQDKLVSGVNIKTLNNESLLGPGNIDIVTGGGTTDHSQLLNRTMPDQHPISAITGLQSTLSSLEDADEQLTEGVVALRNAHVANLKALPVTVNIQNNTVYNVIGFYENTRVGGGQFVWNPTANKSSHNGVTVYSPESIAAWNGTQADIATLLNWSGAGTGVWVRVGVNTVSFEMAGAILDANPTTGAGTDNTLSVNKTFLIGLPVYFSKGYCKVTNQVNMLTGQVLKGSGRTTSMFVIGTDFNLSAGCVLRLGLSEPGAQIEDVGFSFVQTDQGVRTSSTQYPWAIDASSIPRFILNNIRIEGAWNGVNAKGNCGGASVGFMEIGALNVGFDIDGSLDFFHVNTLHFWPFGFTNKTTLLNGVYYDGLGTSLKFGRCDGADFGTISMFRTKMEITANATSGISNSFKLIQLDGDGARLAVSGGVNSISQVYSTKSASNTTKSLEILGGVTTIADLQLLGVNPETDVAVSSGSLSISSGSAIWTTAPVPRMTVSTGTLNVGSFRIKNTPTTVYTVPFVRQSSNGRLVFKNNSFDEKTTGSGFAIEYLTDNAGNYCLNNRLSGYSTSNPSNATLGTYQGTCSYTPVLIGTGTAGVGTYSVQDGKYTFIDDRTILFSASLTWSEHTGTGGTTITLPHTLADFGQRVPLTVYYSSLTVGASKEVGAFVGTTGGVLAVRALDPAGGVALEFFDTAGTINISGFYRRV